MGRTHDEKDASFT